LLLGGIGLAACSPPPPTPDAAALVERAATRTANLRSAHFRLDVSNGAMLLGPSLEVTKAEGDVGRPDLLSMRATVRLGGLVVETEFRDTGGTSYILSPFSQRWEALGGPLTPVPLLDPQQGVPRLVRAIQSPSVTGSETVDTQSGWRVVGRIPAQAVTALVGGAPTTDQTDVTAVVTDDGLVHRLVLRGRVVEGESSELTRTFAFSQFDEPLVVTPPPSSAP
jgi:hypothetical protein